MTSRSTAPVRIAIVGCGAIAREHAIAISAVPTARCTALFDLDLQRAAALRDSVAPEAEVVRALEEVFPRADAAIVAVPNTFHASVAKALLAAGLHVLCEKPLALRTRDAEELFALAAAQGRLLSCGLVRRFFGSTRLAREALAAELLGPPLRVEVWEAVRNWPLSRLAFDRDASGGGVFVDIAPHVLDLLLHWLGPVTVHAYRDDAEGGVDAVADADVSCRTARGEVPAELHFTRAHGSINRTRIYCARGYLEVNPHDRDQITLVFQTSAAGTYSTTARAQPSNPFASQLSNFIGAIKGEVALAAQPNEIIASVAAIEAASVRREPISHAWGSRIESTKEDCGPFRKIFVSGATGSVGTRLVEMWAADGRIDQLRCLIRGYRNGARLKRWPVEVVEADLRDRAAVRRAVQGCDAIVHLGVGDDAEDETESLVEAAKALGIRRFVHMSSAAVYGRGMPTAIEAEQEATPLRGTGEPYADAKAAAEQVVGNARSALDAVILRPHMVYGPGMRWTGELMELLPNGRVCIISDGGWCNLIYVDDLVRAVRCALSSERGFDQPLFVTDGRPLRWSDYILAHARLLGINPPTVHRSELTQPRRTLQRWVRDSVRPIGPIIRSAEFRALVFESPAVQATAFPLYLMLRRSARFAPFIERLRGGGGKRVGSDSGPTFDPTWTEMQLSQARLSADRAAATIGFRAKVDFAEGLRRSATWAAQFGLLDPKAASS